MQYIWTVGWMPPHQEGTGDMAEWGAEQALEYMDSALYLSAAILQLLCWYWILIFVRNLFDGFRAGDCDTNTTHRADQLRKQR